MKERPLGAIDHKEKAEDQPAAKCSVLTVSDTQTTETDESGRIAMEILQKYGHDVILHRIIRNDPMRDFTVPTGIPRISEIS